VILPPGFADNQPAEAGIHMAMALAFEEADKSYLSRGRGALPGG